MEEKVWNLDEGIQGLLAGNSQLPMTLTVVDHHEVAILLFYISI